MRVENGILYLTAFPYLSEVSEWHRQAILLPPLTKVSKIVYLDVDGQRRELLQESYKSHEGDEAHDGMVMPSKWNSYWPVTRYTGKDDAVEIHLVKAEAGHDATAQPQPIK